mmetsp:Transcript_20844/g.27434  ORF Transcript_20844/g.27434 Transcript_20844/m.27434 type:complete len:188 (+) Transcript_20844:62-625(+)|eukprot:CAMPEP_0117767182 /NCGR_PEP_ID=MMETSP0947-20121206/21444_1 /TAXON_ID=44440 /ORGANISM="Chattonella subsalsa, Strain CCMP2191" /LENGTH=187 /DNA_ID=CAMNT_0005590757 /DNA_START=41 /DNA_END=604 /DNA_ORIENTATION=-
MALFLKVVERINKRQLSCCFNHLGKSRFISTGAAFPSVNLKQAVGDEVTDVNTSEIMSGKKVVVFGVPGAFTPTCSEEHLPGFLNKVDDFKSKGVDTVACLSVNDFFVMKEWAKDQKVASKITMLCDGNGELTKAAGLELDLSAHGLGIRCKRFSAVVEDGIVKALNVEPDGAGYSVSSAENTLEQA